MPYDIDRCSCRFFHQHHHGMTNSITLVTTELEETWPQSGEVVLFLGEWCRLYSRREKWQTLGGDVVPYHWNDRTKLRKDFEYLQRLNKQLLLELVPVMNTLHRTDYDARYWRLLLGYWLNLYTAVLFDRWASINAAVKLGLNLKSFIIPVPEQLLAANETGGFIHKATQDPYWNHALFGLLIARMGSINLVTLPATQGVGNVPSVEQQWQTGKFFKNIKKKIATLILYAKRNDRIAMTATYLPRKASWLLDFKFGQFPGLDWSLPAIQESEFDGGKRKWTLPNQSQGDEFGSIARELISQFLPKVFVEGFKKLEIAVSDLPWPVSPRVIWTSNYHFGKEVFNAWAAKKCAGGTRLVIGEHGGLGTGAFNGAHSYEIAIADRYISTGWSDVAQPKIIPIGNFRQVNCKQSSNVCGPAFMVCGIMPRYGFDVRSMMLSSQVLDYIEDQFRFVEALPQRIQQSMLVRLYHKDYEWYQKDRWKERYPNIRTDGGNQSMWQAASNCRIFIGTYNATTYIDSLTLNFPTIMFWNPERWEVKDEALPFFENLKRVGVFHETPESAAQKMTEIWDDVSGWWHSNEVQRVVKAFLDQYAATLPDILERLEQVIREEVEIAEQNMQSLRTE